MVSKSAKAVAKARKLKPRPKGYLMIRIEDAAFSDTEVNLKCVLLRFPKNRKPIREGAFSIAFPRD